MKDSVKTCTHCGKEKSIDEFRTTKKTRDGRYPYCKYCAVKHREREKMSATTVASSMWYELEKQAFESPAGTVLYMNKKMFIEFAVSHPKFRKLYKVWSKRIYGTYKLEVGLKVPLDLGGLFEFENLQFTERMLEKNEVLKPTMDRNFS